MGLLSRGTSRSSDEAPLHIDLVSKSLCLVVERATWLAAKRGWGTVATTSKAHPEAHVHPRMCLASVSHPAFVTTLGDAFIVDRRI